jgi:Family of unknown function (DUF6011)
MIWKWVRDGDRRFYDVGVNDDGSLHNPRGYPEDEVRAAVAAAVQRRHERASKAAKRAAETRRRRQEKKVYEVVRGLRLGERYGPRSHCVVCGKGLGDPQSVERGIGSECWQNVMVHIEGRPT